MKCIVKTEYEKSIRPAWELKDTISIEKRHINQATSRGQYAYFKIKFERSQLDVPIVLETQSLFHKDSITRGDLYEETTAYAETIIRTIEENINEAYVKGFPIINLKITLSELQIHPYDSNELSFKIATLLVMENILTQDNFLRVF